MKIYTLTNSESHAFDLCKYMREKSLGVWVERLA
jgi:hypothetical protein